MILNYNQFKLIKAMIRSGGRATYEELAKEFVSETTGPATAYYKARRTVFELEKKGFLEKRKVRVGYRKRIVVLLTEKGIEIAKKVSECLKMNCDEKIYLATI